MFTKYFILSWPLNSHAAGVQFLKSKTYDRISSYISISKAIIALLQRTGWGLLRVCVCVWYILCTTMLMTWIGPLLMWLHLKHVPSCKIVLRGSDTDFILNGIHTRSQLSPMLHTNKSIFRMFEAIFILFHVFFWHLVVGFVTLVFFHHEIQCLYCCPGAAVCDFLGLTAAWFMPC